MPVEAAFVEGDEGYRILGRQIEVLRLHPDKLVTPKDPVVRQYLVREDLGDGEVDPALLQPFEQRQALGDLGIYGHLRVGPREAGEDPRYTGPGRIFGNSKAQGAGETAASELRHGLVVEGEQAVRIGQELRAIGRRQQPVCRAPEQRATDALLEALDLVADRGLGQAQSFRRPGDAAHFSDGLQGPEGLDIKPHDTLMTNIDEN